MNTAELTDFTDTLSSYRIAKKARDKGFYCITPHRFLAEDKVFGGWINSHPVNTKPNPTEEDIQNYVSNIDSLLIAPTLGIVHTWLQRFHGISVHTEPVKRHIQSDLFEFSPYLVISKKERIKTTSTHTEERDAFEQGIFEALCRLPDVS